MGIADRDYYKGDQRGGGPGFSRPSFNPSKLSVIAWLIIINVGVFMVDMALPVVDLQDYTKTFTSVSDADLDRAEFDAAVPDRKRVPGEMWTQTKVDRASRTVVVEQYRTWHLLNGYGHFSLLKGFLGLEVWRVVTYQFLHANITHLFFNMFGLFIFGGMVEQYLGRKKFLSFYLICGISGGLLYLIIVGLVELGLKLPGTLAHTTMATPLIGASAGVFGVIVACARLQPNARVMLLFPPIPMKLKWMAYGYVGIAAFNLISGGNNAGGDAAHLGGAIAGFYFIRNIHLLRDFLDFGIGSGPKGAHPRPGRPGRGRDRLQKQVDQVLDKLSREGLHSLTAKEKKILERSSKEL